MNKEIKDLAEYIYLNMSKNPKHDKFRMIFNHYDDVVKYLDQETNIEKLGVCLNDKIGDCIVEFEYIDTLKEYFLNVYKLKKE